MACMAKSAKRHKESRCKDVRGGFRLTKENTHSEPRDIDSLQEVEEGKRQDRMVEEIRFSSVLSLRYASQVSFPVDESTLTQIHLLYMQAGRQHSFGLALLLVVYSFRTEGHSGSLRLTGQSIMGPDCSQQR